jgi:hypothetical protein
VQAVLDLDAAIGQRYFVSVVRDNCKNMYPIYEMEVNGNFDLDAWDTRPIEREWRSRLTDLIMEEARAASRGGGDGDGGGYDAGWVDQRITEEQSRWAVRKQRLYPGSALVAVLVDEGV